MKELVGPAVQGTNACLSACQKAGTVKRVIVTSSFAAIVNLGVYPFDYAYSSRDWNTVSQPDKDGKFAAPVPQNGYRYSKIAAEKAAWDFSAKADCSFDVACINSNLPTYLQSALRNPDSGLIIRRSRSMPLPSRALAMTSSP